jgi:putative phosphoribosyl transferase
MALFMRRVMLPQTDGNLVGELLVPAQAQGVIIAGYDTRGPAPGPGAMELGRGLTRSGVAVLLLGLQTGVEEEYILSGWGLDNHAAVKHTAERFEEACAFLFQDPQTKCLRVGLFGTGTGGAAAFLAAAHRPPGVTCVASCGGRPWLAGDTVENVQLPSLIVVGGEDTTGLLETMRMTRRMHGPTTLRLVPGASRSFSEPGTWGDAMRILGGWFHEQFESTFARWRTGWADPEGRWV